MIPAEQWIRVLLADTMNGNIGDIQSVWVRLERFCRRSGISVDDYPGLGDGDPAQCIELIRSVAFYLSRDVALQMLNRKCTEQSNGAKILSSIFDILRENANYSTPLTVDKFLSNVRHRIVNGKQTVILCRMCL